MPTAWELNKILNSISIGIADFEMNIDSLTLLTFIETRIEDLIDLEETLNQEQVKAAQKEREKVSYF